MDYESGTESELESKTWGIIKAHIESKDQRRQQLGLFQQEQECKEQNNGNIWYEDPRVRRLTKGVARITVSFERQLVKHLGELKLSAIPSRKIL